MDSCRPDEWLVLAYIDGDPRAIEIVESWKFNLPVTLMPKEELQTLIEERAVTFAFPRSNDNLEVPGFTHAEDWPTISVSSAYGTYDDEAPHTRKLPESPSPEAEIPSDELDSLQFEDEDELNSGDENE